MKYLVVKIVKLFLSDSIKQGGCAKCHYFTATIFLIFWLALKYTVTKVNFLGDRVTIG